MLKKVIVFIFIFLSLICNSQIGGVNSYRFLDIPMTARAAGVGGSNMSIWGDDVNLIYSNPALLNPTMTKQVALNYSNYVGDLNFGYLAYAHSLNKYGTVAGGLQFYDYGKFVGYDEYGQKTNDFNASDYSINLNYAKPFEDSAFNIGVALKTIISQYDIYKSYASALDFGITYHSKNNLVVSLLAKNVGFVWKEYTNTQAQSQTLPQTVQLGLSYKVAKAPFRLFMVYDQLLKWNLKYISSIDTAGKSNPFNASETAVDSSKFQKFSNRFGNRSDNFMRHITFGTEILLTKNFNLRLAYNYRRQREMTLPERRGANGLSFGFSLRVKRFGFAYSFTKMAFPGNSSIFSISASI
ncbi:MAG: type IX secretion system protein PorQ [Bacteroidota bacterium]|nr:type IX secretion system protein PorQ [Bacteroidota bacterium]MDP3144615.1 type IX secretion system protein PorQ [Bacteroidota bacterium]MDP3556554.1 type IX secretion system protein PorQ [Bacteroidota bacterium]